MFPQFWWEPGQSSEKLSVFKPRQYTCMVNRRGAKPARAAPPSGGHADGAEAGTGRAGAGATAAIAAGARHQFCGTIIAKLVIFVFVQDYIRFNIKFT
jgi:hypothetical protein